MFFSYSVMAIAHSEEEEEEKGMLCFFFHHFRKIWPFFGEGAKSQFPAHFFRIGRTDGSAPVPTSLCAQLFWPRQTTQTTPSPRVSRSLPSPKLITAPKIFMPPLLQTGWIHSNPNPQIPCSIFGPPDAYFCPIWPVIIASLRFLIIFLHHLGAFDV